MREGSLGLPWSRLRETILEGLRQCWGVAEDPCGVKGAGWYE